jgi:hypothetical protein
LQHTLAALGYILFSFVPSSPHISTIPVAQPIREYLYVAKKGDPLTGLAQYYYGSSEYWTTLWNDNPSLVNPSVMSTQTRLKIRAQSPILIENIHKDLMARLLEKADNPPLDPHLAFSEAQNSQVIGGIPPSPSSKEEVSQQQPPTNAHSKFDAVYQAAGNQFGVPWQVLYGLHLTETGLRDGAIASGYGPGPQGPMQFMPGTFNAYAIDGNGDGSTDINNAVDAIYTAANYLAKHGSIDNGLRSYGGNTAGVLAAACQKGYCQ